MPTFNKEKFKKEIVDNYLACALWTEEIDDKAVFEFAPASRKQAEKDVDLFIEKIEENIKTNAINCPDLEDFCISFLAEQLGHDFWLDRNHHGAGAWDRNYPNNVGAILTKIATSFKDINDVFVSGDGSVVIE